MQETYEEKEKVQFLVKELKDLEKAMTDLDVEVFQKLKNVSALSCLLFCCECFRFTYYFNTFMSLILVTFAMRINFFTMLFYLIQAC